MLDNKTFPFTIGHFNCLVINDVDDGNSNCLLIDTGSHKVLIDTGNGDATTPPGRLLERLATAGVVPAAIDMVILSHADPDHIGGAADASGKSAFPQARYLLSQAEWDFWAAKPQRVQASDIFDAAFCQWASLLPVTRLHQVDAQVARIEAESEIVPGIRVVEAAGHTPGMLAVVISSAQEQLLFIADVLYPDDLTPDPSDSAKTIVTPAIVHTWFDADPAQAVSTRDRLFAQAASQQTLLMAYHLPFPGLGYVAQAASSWHWTPALISLVG